MGEDEANDRRRSPGRRAHDHVLKVIWRELDEMKADLRRYLDEVKAELRDDVSRLDAALAKLEEKLTDRVTGLARFEIEERTKAGEKIVERAKKSERWQKVSIAFGIVGTCMGITAVLVAVIP